jgi:hypothetical protein
VDLDDLAQLLVEVASPFGEAGVALDLEEMPTGGDPFHPEVRPRLRRRPVPARERLAVEPDQRPGGSLVSSKPVSGDGSSSTSSRWTWPASKRTF